MEYKIDQCRIITGKWIKTNISPFNVPSAHPATGQGPVRQHKDIFY
jgi:hypothetical protein